jgi:hypothetical protein
VEADFFDMRTLLKLFGFLVIAVGRVMALIKATGYVASPKPGDKAALAIAEKATRSLKAQPYWDRFTIDQAEGNMFSVTIHYKAAPPLGMVNAEADTKAMVRAILAELIRTGHKPMDEYDSVFASAWQDGLKGQTGAALVRVFGTAHYDFNNDQIAFTPEH